MELNRIASNTSPTNDLADERDNQIVFGSYGGSSLCVFAPGETCIVLPSGVSVETLSNDPEMVYWTHEVAASIYLGSSSCED
jgi:hypothetical protein